MNNLVQNFVLDGDEWVSRPVDVYQIMSRAQDPTSGGMPDPQTKPQAQVPDIGLLSKTVLGNPLFKFVLPANIRHRDLNDIVLVGEDVIHLKEIHDYGHLRQVASKSDFKGRIITARVFSQPREVAVGVSSPVPRKPALHRARRSMTGDEEDSMPPEVIVLTLTSKTLMFLWAQQSRTGVVTFKEKTLRLPAGATPFDRFGAFLAIDPKLRAMAVAASEGQFILYKTKSMGKWQEEVHNGKETIPIEDERLITMEGRIQHMEFLSSGTGRDDYHVVLLFVIVHQGKTKLTCFDWDCTQDLSKATARTERVLVDFEDHNPSLLIPLSRTSDFLLVLDAHISVYKDILSGAPQRRVVPIDASITPSLMPGDSKTMPRWVAWDKTLRNPEFSKEVFYIAREDGRVIYAERSSAGDVDIVEAGEWPYRIDTAFACLNVDNSEFSRSYPDVLIAGGIGNDGLLCKVGAWPAEYSYAVPYTSANQLTYIESIANWTPLTDLCVARISSLSTPVGHNRPKILVADGLSPHGEISELRRGLQSFIDDSFGGMNGCTGLWALDYGSHTVVSEGRGARQHWTTFAITLPPETVVIRVMRTQSESRGEFSGAWEEGQWDQTQLPSDDEPIEDGIMRDVETITACPWSDQFALQITRSEARLLLRPNLQLSDSIVYSNSLLLAASRPGCPIIAVTYREAGITYLEVVTISHNGSFMKTSQLANNRHQLDHDPTCLELFDLDGTLFVLASTFGSKLFLFRVNDQGSLSLMVEESLGHGFYEKGDVLLENAVVLSSKDQRILVCTTRSGTLLSSPMIMNSEEMTRFEWRPIKMGDTSARIMASSTDASAAFVSCGSDFCRIRCPTSETLSLEVDSIWFTNRTGPAYQQAPITAMYQLPLIRISENIGRNLGGFLFAVSGDQLLFSQLESDVRWTECEALSRIHNDIRAVPRKIFTGSKPTNLLYLKSYRKMVISTIEAKEEKAPPNGCRVLHSSIHLINMYDDKPLDETDIKIEEGHDPINRLIAATFPLKHGERVYSITEWPFVDHRGRRYTLLIVGTGVPGHTSKETGRKLILSPGKSGSKLILQKDFTYDQPVYCIAVHGNASTVSAIGKLLTFEIFDSEAGKIVRRATKALPSVGTHITVQAPFVYVSTLQHSHLCFELVNTGQEGTYEFQQVFTDSRERNCAHHLGLQMPSGSGISDHAGSIILVTDKKAGSITGLYHPPERRQKNSSDTLFEACLPHTVVRLQRGDIRPPWRRPATANCQTVGVLMDDMLGACSDGTVYSFSILSAPARHMLRFLQNIIEEKRNRDPQKQFTVTKYRGGSIQDVLMNGADGEQDFTIHAHVINPRLQENGHASPRFKHVDGDLLRRWLDEDGNLDKLIQQDTDRGVLRLFLEFSRALLQNDELNTEKEAMTKTRQWLNEILMPLL